MANEPQVTPDEMIIFSMARQIHDGELVVQGLATPLVAAAYLLARQTHAPNLYFASAIGQSLCREPAPLGLTRVEGLWLDRAMLRSDFVEVATAILPTMRPKEFFRPAQVDRYGNFNNIALGDNYRSPRLRLPGTGGIPDVSTFLDDICLYVPRHSRLTFASQIDYISGLGHSPLRTHGSGPRYLVTDLGQFDFYEGCMRLTSYHPDATIERIKALTGFELAIAPDVTETELPSPRELRLLREEIDPLNIRKLESLGGTARRQLLREIVAVEAGTPLGGPLEKPAEISA